MVGLRSLFGGWFLSSEESPNRRTRKLGSDEQLGLVVGLYSPGESPVRAFCSEESPNRRTRKLGSVVVGVFSSEESPNRRSRKLGSDEQLGLVVVLYSPGESPVRALFFFVIFFLQGNFGSIRVIPREDVFWGCL